MAELCYQKAHYLAKWVAEADGVELLGGGHFFNEFVVRLPRPAAEVNAAFLEHGFLGGYDLATEYPGLGDAMLLCATEMNTREEIDRFAEALVRV